MQRFAKSTLRFLLSHQFYDLERYLDRLELLLVGELKDHERWFAEYTSGLSEEEGNAAAEFYAEDFFALRDDFPRLLCYSTFSSAYGVIERDMLSACRFHFRQQHHDAVLARDLAMLSTPDIPPPSAPSRPRLKYVEDALRYWQESGLDVAQALPLWMEIENYKEVRNQVVHDDGQRDQSSSPSDRSRKVDAYVADRVSAGKEGISFERERLVLTPDFCREAIKTAKAFFDDLVGVIPGLP